MGITGTREGKRLRLADHREGCNNPGDKRSWSIHVLSIEEENRLASFDILLAYV
jgi:hypothetical protein